MAVIKQKTVPHLWFDKETKKRQISIALSFPIQESRMSLPCTTLPPATVMSCRSRCGVTRLCR